MNSKNDLSSLIMLQLMIVLLKLTGVSPIAMWSWIWVLSFTWIPFTVGAFVLTVLKVWKDRPSQ